MQQTRAALESLRHNRFWPLDNLIVHGSRLDGSHRSKPLTKSQVRGIIQCEPSEGLTRPSSIAAQRWVITMPTYWRLRALPGPPPLRLTQPSERSSSSSLTAG